MSTGIIKSISYDQEELLRNIVDLHLDGRSFECDPTYSKGIFYRHIPEPKYKFDLVAQVEEVIEADARSLPLPDESLSSIMFDPPFLAQSGKGSKIKDRFGDYPTIEALWQFYEDAMREFYRILKPKGVLVFKCQDTVDSGKNYFSHVEIMNRAAVIGYHPKDLFILLAKHRMGQWNMKKQQHARKHHSYFWVFEKRPRMVRYGFLNSC